MPHQFVFAFGLTLIVVSLVISRANWVVLPLTVAAAGGWGLVVNYSLGLGSSAWAGPVTVFVFPEALEITFVIKCVAVC